MSSINAIIGNTITPEPILEMISNSPNVVLSSFSEIVNFGKSKSGKPAGIKPEIYSYYNIFETNKSSGYKQFTHQSL